MMRRGASPQLGTREPSTHRWAEVEDFVDLPQLRDKHRDLKRDAAIASLPAFAAVWDNPDDEVCDVL